MPLIAIIGPTASGKSALGLALAKKFYGFVISADSQQVYKHAAIGTNQPNGTLQKHANHNQFKVKNVPHFFIGERSPSKPWTAVEFQKRTNRLLDKPFITSHTQSGAAFLVGGTGLYISAIVDSYSFPQGKPNLKLRKQLESKSLKQLLNQLKKLDPATYAVIEQKNKRRLVRALEYVLSTGTSFIGSKHSSPRANTLIIGLKLSKTKLRKAIEKRTASMWKRGLVKETKYLLKHYPRAPILNSIGYRETVSYLKDEYDATTCQGLINIHTWQYARRQMTWFKRMPNIHWVAKAQQAEHLTHKFLSSAT